MEPKVLNLTKYAAEHVIFDAPSVSTTIVKAVFSLNPPTPKPVNGKDARLQADIFAGEPKAGNLQYETDFVPFKPRTDVVCVGKAYAPGGRPVEQCEVSFGVSSCIKTIRVFGNRRWVSGLGGLTHRMTEPELFKTMAISYENAYGGNDPADPKGFELYAPNPIGKGYSRKGKALSDLHLPNLEDPQDLIKSWRGQPRPMSFGPVGRTWEPRNKRVGTYDQAWLKERAPKLPPDFDEGYYNCAPNDQQIQGYVRGDEEFTVENMHPEHPHFHGRLPGVKVRALVDQKQHGTYRLEEITMNLDTLWVDMEALQLVLVWRGRVSLAVPDANATVLVVEEPLGPSPRPPESYRPEIEKQAAEDQEAGRVIEETEKELAQIEAQRAAATAAQAAPESL